METLNFDSLSEFAPKSANRKTFDWSKVYANEKQVCKVLNVSSTEDKKAIRKEIRDRGKLDNFISNLPSTPSVEQKKVIKSFFALICTSPVEITFLKKSNLDKITAILSK